MLKGILIMLFCTCFSLLNAAEQNILLGADGKPACVVKGENVRVSVKTGTISLSLSPGESASFYLKLDPEWNYLLLEASLKANGIVSDEKNEKQALIYMQFQDENSKNVPPWPKTLTTTGTNDWKKYQQIYKLPKSAVFLHFMPIHRALKGQFEIDNLSLTPLKSLDEIKDPIEQNILINTNDQPVCLVKGKAVCNTKDGKLSTLLDAGASASFYLTLQPGWKYLKLQCLMSSKELVPGKQKDQDGRIHMHFQDAKLKPVPPWPRSLTMSGNNDWKRQVEYIKIPENAAFISVSLVNNGEAGTLSFDQLELVPLYSLKNVNQDAVIPFSADNAKLWLLDDAWKRSNSFREEISLNGLWQFFPVKTEQESGRIPSVGSGWGYFKVPGIWPGKYGFQAPADAQQIIYSSLKSEKINGKDINYAWYQREVTPPAGWSGRKIELNVEFIQTLGKVFVDGKHVGDIRFPGGSVELTDFLKPGKKSMLAIFVAASTEEESVFFSADDRAHKIKPNLLCRGITGDVWLRSFVTGHYLDDVLIVSSVSSKMITCDVGFHDLPPGRYLLQAEIKKNGKTVKLFKSSFFDYKPSESKKRHSFSAPWDQPELWDTDHPERVYSMELSLADKNEKILDTILPESFGFREFTIDGRNFRLNGKIINIRSIVAPSVNMGADKCFPEILKQAITESQNIGGNYLSVSYSAAPGMLGYMRSFYDETAKAGMLTGLTMPHPKDYNWELNNPKVAAGFTRDAEYLIRKFQNYPNLVFYAMNHNAVGYKIPPKNMDAAIDRKAYRQELENSERNRIGVLAGNIVKSLDNSRVVYHHAGNLEDLFCFNFYPNWMSAQERSDFFEIWERKGERPVLLVEYGLPHVANWSSYRGPDFIWVKNVPQHLLVNEYNAEYLGEKSYILSEAKKALYDKQAQVCTANKPVHISSIVGMLEDISDVGEVRKWFSRTIVDYRARGISIQPWDQYVFWKWTSRNNMPFEVTPYAASYSNLKRPGIVPDLLQCPGNTDPIPLLSSGRKYQLSDSGLAIKDVFRPVLCRIAGKSGDFSEQSHNFFPGDEVKKQLQIINDMRENIEVTSKWEIPELKQSGKFICKVQAGCRADTAFSFTIPPSFKGDSFRLQAEFRLPDGSIQYDSMTFNVFSPSFSPIDIPIKIFDPEESLIPLLQCMKLNYSVISKTEELKPQDLFIIGRNALEKLPFPISDKIQKGLKVMIMEHGFDYMQMFGFRAHIHSLQNVFDTKGKMLHDWRGSSTLMSPFSESKLLYWNGFFNQTPYQTSKRGILCQVPLEKPQKGNFMPLFHGGFDLQYSPVLELAAGEGAVMFCQFSIVRSENDAEALTVFHSLLKQLATYQPKKEKKLYYCGGEQGKELLSKLEFPFEATNSRPASDSVLFIASGATPPPGLRQVVENGLNVFLLGLSGQEMDQYFPGTFRFENKKYYSDYIPELHKVPVLAGINNADLHWRNGIVFDGFAQGSGLSPVLSVQKIGKGLVVALQLAPWSFSAEDNQFRTTRRRLTWFCSRILNNMTNNSHAPFLTYLDGTSRNAPYAFLPSDWLGKTDPEKRGIKDAFFQRYHSDSSWRRVTVPGYFDKEFPDLQKYLGWFWYQLKFDLPSGFIASETMTLDLGAVDDESTVWLNGVNLGSLNRETNPKDYYCAGRKFTLKKGALKIKDNLLTILCNNLRGKRWNRWFSSA